jgi:HEAT repeat protein
MRRNAYLLAAVLLSALIGASSNARGKSVEELKGAGDLRGLVAKLGDHRALVRREAAVALPGVVDKVKDPATLNPIIGRLIDVRFRDPWKTTREYSGRALMNALNKTKDQVVLSNALQPLLDALDQGQVDLERRRYAAVALSVVVMRLERVDLLRPRIPDLLAATFKDPDEGVRKYAERALQHTLMKLDHEPTLTIAAHPLAAHLDSEALHFRSYSAVMLSVVVRKIKDRDTLKSLLGALVQRFFGSPTSDRNLNITRRLC